MSRRARVGFGALGGPFAWYYLIKEGGGGVAYFIAWMWTDTGTSRMLGQVFRGNDPAGHNIHVIKPGLEVPGFAWREIRGGLIMGTPTQHVSWVYTNGSGANEISRQLQSSHHGEMCKKYGTCTMVRNTQGQWV